MHGHPQGRSLQPILARKTILQLSLTHRVAFLRNSSEAHAAAIITFHRLKHSLREGFMDTQGASMDWSFKGMRTLILENKLLRVSILLDKGSDIFEVKYKPLDVDVIWHTPWGYRDPSGHVQSLATEDGSFLDLYGGGWNDIFPNFGQASANRGTRWGLHGESSLLPWTCEIGNTEDGGEPGAKLSMECVRYPLSATKLIKLDRAETTLHVVEDIRNIGEQEVELSWAQHIAFGEPFVSEHLSIDIPAVKARTQLNEVKQERLSRNKIFEWPIAPGLSGKGVDLQRIPDHAERVQDDLVITELREPRYRLYNSKLQLGVEVTWNPEVFHFLWYWLNWGVLDYPWFGRARVLALEPVTGSEDGLASNINASKAVSLAPGATLQGRIDMRLFAKPEPISRKQP